MAQTIPTRLVVCVDGTWCDPDGAGIKHHNYTNVSQIDMSVKKGECYDSVSGKTFNQVRKYYSGIGSADARGSFQRLKAGISGNGFEKQIRDVYEDCCKLQGPDDEVWLYGFSRGAYVVRAVAGLLHHFRALTSAGSGKFKETYDEALKIYGPLRKEPKEQLGKRWNFLDENTRKGPRIQFVGVFDTVKAVADKGLYDISFNNSIQHLRHTLALHEDRSYMDPESILPVARDKRDKLVDRTFVQAWFAGAHIDMGGSSAKAGLSLYPLQWMIIESAAKGLCLGFAGDFGGRAEVQNPLDVIFPPTAGLGKGADRWSCTSENGITTSMHDLRMVHTLHESRFGVLINQRQTFLIKGLKKRRTPFDEKGNINGFFPYGPQGTIIHPSVYLLLDENVNVAFGTQEFDFQAAIDDVRELMLGTSNGKVVQGFWTEHEIIPAKMPTAIRVLVCGNTGVGKSTLINKVFGVPVAESSARMRGVHDISKEITFESRPDLIVHDSGGFETARTQDFDIVEDFLKTKSQAGDLKDRLHVIWFCLLLSDNRTSQAGTVNLFQSISKYAPHVPVVVVATKADQFLDQKAGEYRRSCKKEGKLVDESTLQAHTKTTAQEQLQLIEKEILDIPQARADAFVAVSAEDDHADSIKHLTKTMAQCFSDEMVRLLYIRAQTSCVELKVSSATNRVLQLYKRILLCASGTTTFPLGASVTRYGAATDVCHEILKHFGLPSVSADTAIQVVRANVWEDLGNHAGMLWAEAVAGFCMFLTVGTCGLPFFLAGAVVNAPIVIPAITRLFLMLAADLIIILARAFKDAAERQVGQPQQRDLLAAARAYRAFAPAVHSEIAKVVPRRNMIASFQVGKVSKHFRETVEKFRIEVIKDLDSGRPKAYSMDDHSVESLFGSQGVQDLKEMGAGMVLDAKLEGSSPVEKM